MHVAAIIAAGGMGTRLGGARPKQLMDLGDGTMMLARSIDAMGRCQLVDEIVVAVPSSAAGEWESLRRSSVKPLTVVSGGPRRQDSVAKALARVSAGADIVVIHDAARPFVTPGLIERVVRSAQEHGAAIAALVASDTVKQVQAGAGGVPVIRATLPRESIFLAQTPQAFRRTLLTAAIESSVEGTATDEAMLVEQAGHPVYLVDGEATNIKVTTPDDWELARARVADERGPDRGTLRIGTGYDLHRLVHDRPLVLGGVRVPFERGLSGHSDADIVCHAVTDAVLGAAGLGDIGRLFPDTEERWKGADSVELLRQALALVRSHGYRVANVDVTVIAERPKLIPYLNEMRANLARALAVSETAVSIKGKTNEGVGEIGRSEAMACHAVALLARS